jgi:hypothetical protein
VLLSRMRPRKPGFKIAPPSRTHELAVVRCSDGAFRPSRTSFFASYQKFSDGIASAEPLGNLLICLEDAVARRVAPELAPTALAWTSATRTRPK